MVKQYLPADYIFIHYRKLHILHLNMRHIDPLHHVAAAGLNNTAMGRYGAFLEIYCSVKRLPSLFAKNISVFLGAYTKNTVPACHPEKQDQRGKNVLSLS